MTPIRPVVLCILDGIGVAKAGDTNAVSSAKTPYLDSLFKKYPHMELAASGPAVGLPPETMGNSEVGHITIGAGRVQNQFLRRFALENFGWNRALAKFISDTKKGGGVVHMVGLASDGKVHSDINDALKIARIFKHKGLKIIWHFVADGRDVGPKTAEQFVRKIRRALGKGVEFGSIAGRYYTMDRNNNWERTQAAFDAIVGRAKTRKSFTIDGVIQHFYKRGVTDEFIHPVRFVVPPLEPKDGVLFFNYRADRARQFLKTLVKHGHKNMLCFSQYGEGLDEDCPALLPDLPPPVTLGDILTKNGKTQTRLAETEKYNHVTYFFDAERTLSYPGQEKILVPSPKVATFDLAPEMAAGEITDEFLRNVGKKDVMIVNYANGDMVGHTGNMRQAIKAVEFLDSCLAKIVPATIKQGGVILITSDHGNAEKMADWRGHTWTAHTTNPVPLILVSENPLKLEHVKDAGLANIAPTILKLLGIEPPEGMAEPLV